MHTMDQQPETLLKFPSIFPLKVMGKNSDEFRADMKATVLRVVGDESVVNFDYKVSSGDTYLSITATFVATSKTQVDSLYLELKKDPRVLMML